MAFDGSTWGVQAHDPVSGDVELIESSRASTISFLQVYRDRRLIFLADGQLWLSDGTSQGTRIVLATPQILEMQVVGETIFMVTEDAIWKSDGTSTGTQLVAEVSDGVIDQNLGELTPVGDTVFFSVRPRFVRPTIWRSDGTTAGTFRSASAVLDL